MPSLWFDIAHLFAGGVLVLSLVLLYQDRITAAINIFALQAIALALSVGWQAFIQREPFLLVTALLALTVKGFVIPTALHRIVRRLDIQREVEQVIGGGVRPCLQASRWSRCRSSWCSRSRAPATWSRMKTSLSRLLSSCSAC